MGNPSAFSASEAGIRIVGAAVMAGSKASPDAPAAPAAPGGAASGAGAADGLAADAGASGAPASVTWASARAGKRSVRRIPAMTERMAPPGERERRAVGRAEESRIGLGNYACGLKGRRGSGGARKDRERGRRRCERSR